MLRARDPHFFLFTDPPTIEEHQLAVGIKKAFNGSVIVSCPVTDWKCQMSVEGSHSMTVHVVTMGIGECTRSSHNYYDIKYKLKSDTSGGTNLF